MSRTTITICLAVMLAATSASAQIEVPGDFAVLQDAIDASPPGGLILVEGGTYDPVVIDKPLTIVGVGGLQSVRIDNTDQSTAAAPFSLVPCIELDGDGDGTVVLSGITTGGVADGRVFSQSGAGIAGGGFDELHVVDCDIGPAQWTFLTGLGVGKPGIDGGAPYILVSGSTVTGGLTDTDFTDSSVVELPDGAPAIRAGGSSVVVIDSSVRGGQGPLFAYFGKGCDFLGPDPCGLIEGDGGTGIEADVLYRGASLILGGEGQPVICESEVLCTLPDGLPVDASVLYDLGSECVGTGAMKLGSMWTLSWDTPGDIATLFVGLGPEQPYAVNGIGFAFFDMDTAARYYVPGGLQSLDFRIPAEAALIGLEPVVQIVSAEGGFTKPVVGVLSP